MSQSLRKRARLVRFNTFPVSDNNSSEFLSAKRVGEGAVTRGKLGTVTTQETATCPVTHTNPQDETEALKLTNMFLAWSVLFLQNKGLIHKKVMFYVVQLQKEY